MKINTNNKELIVAELDKIQKLTKCRELSYDDITRAEGYLLAKLADLPKRLRIGATMSVGRDHGSFARAYKFQPESTFAELRYTSTGIFIVKIGREGCRKDVFNFPEENIAEIKDILFKNLRNI